MAEQDRNHVSSKRVTHGQLKELLSDQQSAFKGSRARATESREMMAGRLQPWIHPKVKKAMSGIEKAMRPMPDRFTRELKLVGMVADRLPEMSRLPVALGGDADDVATEAEQIGNTLIRRYLPYRQIVELLAAEGEAALITSPAGAFWEHLSGAYDYCDPDAYKALDKEIRAQFEPDPNVKHRWRQFKKLYHRDASGRKPISERFSGMDREQTAREFQKAFTQAQARKAPLLYRPISALQGFPINPRFVGTGVDAQGLLVVSKLTRMELLRRNFRSRELSGHLEPSELYGEVELIEGWLTDENNIPYTAYSINGENTWKVNRETGEECEVINLADEFGLHTLPVGYAYGWHYATTEPDDRGVPFPYPFIGSWLGREKLTAMLLYHTEQTAFMGWAYKPDAAAMASWSNSNTPPTIAMDPLSFIPIPGDIMDIVHRGASPEAAVAIQLLGSDADSEGISEGAMGGGGASSAIERSTIGRDSMLAVGAIREGARQLAEIGASHGWEILASMGRHTGQPIKLAVIPTSPVRQDTEDASPRSTIVTIDPDLAAGDYTLIATFPTKPGDNLPLVTVLAQLHTMGKITTRQFLEWSFGDPSPEITMAELEGEAFRKTPIGRQRTMLRLARYTADQQTQDLIKQFAAGQVNADGLPAGLKAGLETPPPPGGQGGPTSTQAQVAGMVGGATNGGGAITTIGNQGGNTGGLSSAGQASPVGAANGR